MFFLASVSRKLQSRCQLRLQSSKGSEGLGDPLPRWPLMTDKLMMVVGRRSQFLTTWVSTGLLECLHDIAASFPQREKEIQIDYGTYEICLNLNNYSCLSVCPCFRHKMFNLQSIKFCYSSATMTNDSTNIHPPKRSPAAYRSQKTSIKL